MQPMLMVPAMCGLLTLAVAGAEKPAATISRQGDRFEVKGACYEALVGGQSQLMSLKVKGIEFIENSATLRRGNDGDIAIAGLSCSEFGAWANPQRMPGMPQVDGNRLSAEGNGWKLTYTFLADAIELEVFGSPGGGRSFTGGYPSAQLAVSLRSDLDRACNPAEEGDIGWPVARKHEPGDYAVLAANGVGLLFEKVSALQTIRDQRIVAPKDHRLNLIVLSTMEVTQKPHKWLIRVIKEPALAYALAIDVASPVPGHLFSKTAEAVFPVTVQAHYGQTVQGAVSFAGQGYVFTENKVCAEVPIELTSATPQQTVQLKLKPPLPGHYTGLVSVKVNGRSVASKRLGFVTQPERIPKPEVPADFDRFWDDAMRELAKTPLDLTLEEQTDKETPSGRAYKVKYRSWQGRWAWAWLYVPKKPGKVPATVQCPAVSNYQPGLCQMAGGDLRIAVAVHGGDIAERPAKSDFDYMNTGIADRETYMLRYGYCCLVRCYDIIRSRPECNGEVHVTGGSQGAGLSLVLGGLRPEIREIRGLCVALCRIDWTILGLAKWGPRLPAGEDAQKIARIVSYYDPARFAHRIKAQNVVLGIGLFDFCAPAEGIFSAINALPPGVPCRVYADPFGGHFTYNHALLQDAAQGVTVPRWEGTTADNKLNAGRSP